MSTRVYCNITYAFSFLPVSASEQRVCAPCDPPTNLWIVPMLGCPDSMLPHIYIQAYSSPSAGWYRPIILSYPRDCTTAPVQTIRGCLHGPKWDYAEWNNQFPPVRPEHQESFRLLPYILTLTATCLISHHADTLYPTTILRWTLPIRATKELASQEEPTIMLAQLPTQL